MANSTIIYACTNRGLAVVNKPGTLPDWLPPRFLLEGQDVMAVWADAGPPIRILAVANVVLLSSENGGRTWERVDLPATGPVVSLQGADEPPLLWAGLSDNRLLGSMDRGATWAPISTPPAGPARQTIAAVDAGNLRVSNDGGSTWRALAGSPHDIMCAEAIPGGAGKPSAIVVGTEEGLYISQDGGISWRDLDLPGLPPRSAVTALARDPERRDRIYAAAGGLIFESGNRGQTWEPVNNRTVGTVNRLFVLRI